MSQPGAQSACPTCHAPLGPDARFCGACGGALVATATAAPARGGAPDPYGHLLGREIGGRYRILTKLGEGGMGAVFRAEQLSLKRVVALKVLRPELSGSPELVRRFNAEAELAAKLNHPSTVTLFDFGQDVDGSLFIAMELLEGVSLRDVLVQGGPLAPARMLAITEQVCASLADAHGHGIVHRDLKPDNVMLVRRGKLEDVVRVLDFGIAKLRDDQGDVTQLPMTQAGDLLGTPQYMAPEQIRGEKVDARTDVYALGVMLYEMVTGRLPFDAPSLMALLSKHLTEMPPPPSHRRPDLGIPPVIDELIMAALAKDPAARPQTMEVVAEALAAIARGMAAPIVTPSSSGYPTPSTRSLPPGVPPLPAGIGPAPAPSGVQPLAYAAPSGVQVGGYAAPSGVQPGGYAAPSAVQPGGFAPLAQPGYPAPAGPSSPPPGSFASRPGHGAVPAPAAPTPAAFHQPAAIAAPPRHSPWPWILLVLFLAGGGAGGFILWQQRAAATDASDADAGEPDSPAEPDPDEAVPTAPADFSIDSDRELYDDGASGAAGPSGPDLGALPDGVWHEHVLGFAVKIPGPFQAVPGMTDGAEMYAGSFAGHNCTIAYYGMRIGFGGELIADADLAEMVRTVLVSYGGSPRRFRWATRAGRAALVGVTDFPSLGTRAEVVLYKGDPIAALVIFAVDQRVFRQTQAFRKAFFSSWVRPPA